MGSGRARPKRLAEKLKQIRTHLGLSQRQFVKALGLKIPYTNISKFELNKNEPNLIVLLAYARLAKVEVEQIVDDEIELDL